MKVDVETQPNCITSIKVVVPPERVRQEWERVSRDFQNHARVPGFRPGKVPAKVIETRFKKEIQDELTRKLLNETTREVIRERELKVLSISGVEDLEMGLDETLRFKATLITAPVFELPDYKGIEVKVPGADVTEEDVDRALGHFREQSAEYKDVEGRALATGDFAVVDYSGTLDGQPLAAGEGGAPEMVSGSNDFWIKMAEDSFLPGFCAAIEGMQVSEEREFPLALPADLPNAELAGKEVVYRVTLKGIKEQALPELDDAFASKILNGKTLVELREEISKDLVRRKEEAIEQEKRGQVLRHLIGSVECELPERMVRGETQRILGEIVRENTERGVGEEVLQEHKQEIITSASQNARDRLKGNFILLRIAEKEGIRVEEGDFRQRLAMLSIRYRMKPDKLLKELEKHDAIGSIEEEILLGKVLDFLVANASVAAA